MWILTTIVFDVITYVEHISLFSVGSVIAYTMPVAVSNITVLQFCSLVNICKNRFRWLNEKIIELSKESSKVNFSTSATKVKLMYENLKLQNCFIIYLNNFCRNVSVYHENNLLRMLQNIRRKHYELCTLTETINASYSVQLLTTIAEIFVTLLSTLFYYVQLQLFKRWSKVIIRTDMFYFYTCFLLSTHILQIIILVLVCSKTKEEVRNGKDLDIWAFFYCRLWLLDRFYIELILLLKQFNLRWRRMQFKRVR